MNENNGWYDRPSISQEYHVLHHSLDRLSCPGSVQGAIDPERMAMALRIVIADHPILRTRFIIENGFVKRELFPFSALPLVFVDKKSSSPEEFKSFVQSFEQLQREKLPPRDKGPLFHCAFIQDSPTSSIFLLTIDHIICDAWSIKLFSDALFTAYEKVTEGHPIFDTNEDVFGEFAQWQREKITQSAPLIAEHWSKTEISQETPPQKASAPLIKQQLVLSMQTTQLLMFTAKASKISLFTYLLAAFNRLLATLPSPPRNIRMVHSGRFRHRWKSAIGLFASSLLVELPEVRSPDDATLLKRTQQSLYRAIKWSYVPIEYIQSLGNEEAAKARIEIDYMPVDLFTHPGETLRVSTLLDLTLHALEPDLDMQLLCYHQHNQLGFFFIFRNDLCEGLPDQISNHFEKYLIELIELSPKATTDASSIHSQLTDEKNTIS